MMLPIKLLVLPLTLFSNVFCLSQTGITEKKDPPKTADQFYFNKKISFTAKSSGKQVNSYFFLNTKNGQTAYDRDLAQQLGARFQTTEFAIRFPDDNHFLYSKHPVRLEKVVSITKGSPEWLPDFIQNHTQPNFFKDYFQATGRTQTVGDKSQFASFELQGVDLRGTHFIALLGKDIGFTSGPATPRVILSAYGLGYIEYEGSYHLLTGWEGDDYIARVEQVEDVNVWFDGKFYQPLQEKLHDDLNTMEQHFAKGTDEEKKAIDQQERQQREQSARATANYEILRLRAIDAEMIELKKQMLAKKDSLQQAFLRSSRSVAVEEGDLNSVQSNSLQLMNSNAMIELMILETRSRRLAIERKMLRAKDELKKADYQAQYECAGNQLDMLGNLLQEFEQLDRRYRNNEAELFRRKSVLQQERIAAISTLCQK